MIKIVVDSVNVFTELHEFVENLMELTTVGRNLISAYDQNSQ